MDRRSFLKSLIGGVAAAAAVRTFPFRIYSFPSMPETGLRARFIARHETRLVGERLRLYGGARGRGKRIWVYRTMEEVIRDFGPSNLWPNILSRPSMQDFTGGYLIGRLEPMIPDFNYRIKPETWGLDEKES
jgi:hypothetical protein